jgi:hypothetical protein
LFLLYCFEWELRWWERLLGGIGAMAMEPGEAERRFGDYFEIERVAGEETGSWFMPAYAAYLMARKSSGSPYLKSTLRIETEKTNENRLVSPLT